MTRRSGFESLQRLTHIEYHVSEYQNPSKRNLKTMVSYWIFLISKPFETQLENLGISYWINSWIWDPLWDHTNSDWRFENSHPAITGGSQTSSYSCTRLRGVPSDSMVLVKEGSDGLGKLATHKKEIFSLVVKIQWLILSLRHGFTIWRPPSCKLIYNPTCHYWVLICIDYT